MPRAAKGGRRCYQRWPPVLPIVTGGAANGASMCYQRQPVALQMAVAGAAKGVARSCNRLPQVLQGRNSGVMGVFSDDGAVGGAALRRRATPHACRGADAAIEVLSAGSLNAVRQGRKLEGGDMDFAGGAFGKDGGDPARPAVLSARTAGDPARPAVLRGLQRYLCERSSGVRCCGVVFSIFPLLVGVWCSWTRVMRWTRRFRCF